MSWSKFLSWVRQHQDWDHRNSWEAYRAGRLDALQECMELASGFDDTETHVAIAGLLEQELKV